MTLVVLKMNSIQIYNVALFQMMFVYVQQLEPSCYKETVGFPAGF